MPAEAVSFKDQLLAARKHAQGQRTVELDIPGFDGRLAGTFRALDDYSEVRAIVKRHERVRDPAQQELYVGADTLIAASVDTHAVIDGEHHPLGVTLGLSLARYLELGDGCENDRQGVFAVVPSTMGVMALFAEYDQWLKGARVEVEEELAGESGAPS